MITKDNVMQTISSINNNHQKDLLNGHHLHLLHHHGFLNQNSNVEQQESEREMLLKVLYQEQVRRTKELELEILRLKLENSKQRQQEQLSSSSSSSSSALQKTLQSSLVVADLLIPANVTMNSTAATIDKNSFSSNNLSMSEFLLNHGLTNSSSIVSSSTSQTINALSSTPSSSSVSFLNDNFVMTSASTSNHVNTPHLPLNEHYQHQNEQVSLLNDIQIALDEVHTFNCSLGVNPETNHGDFSNEILAQDLAYLHSTFLAQESSKDHSLKLLDFDLNNFHDDTSQSSPKFLDNSLIISNLNTSPAKIGLGQSSSNLIGHYNKEWIIENGNTTAQTLPYQIKPIIETENLNQPSFQDKNMVKSSSSYDETGKKQSSNSQQAKRKFLEKCATCFKCKQDKAHFLLHCTLKCSDNSDVLKYYAVDFLCSDCQEPLPEELVPITSHVDGQVVCLPCATSKRKRSRHSEADLHCHVCKTMVGKGGFRKISLTKCSVEDSPNCSGHLRSIDKTTLDVDGHRTEIICIPCALKYRFCTECGGGGKFRTGKYRPIQMFNANRKTCCLSHVRLGGSGALFHVYAAHEITPDIFISTENVHMDGFYSLYAIPEIMEAQDSTIRQYGKLKKLAEDSWHRVCNSLTTLEGQYFKNNKYLACAFMENTHRKNGWRKAARDSKQAIDSAGTVQIAYATGAVDPNLAYLFSIHAIIRATSVSTIHILENLLNELVERVVQDTTSSMIEFVSIFIHKEHPKIESYMKKLGFMTVKEFTAKHRYIDHSVIDAILLKEKSENPFTMMITKVEEFGISKASKLQGSFIL